MPTQQNPPTDEHRAVVRFLETVIRDAEYMADVTAAFLKAQGYRPHKRSLQNPDAVTEGSPVVRQAQGFLLNLAAALRLVRWENSRLRPYLPSSLPTPADAFRNLVPPRDEGAKSDGTEIVPAISADVFRTWMERFCHSGQTSIGVDVVLELDGTSENDLLDSLADFLWEHRHLASPEGQL